MKLKLSDATFEPKCSRNQAVHTPWAPEPPMRTGWMGPKDASALRATDWPGRLAAHCGDQTTGFIWFYTVLYGFALVYMILHWFIWFRISVQWFYIIVYMISYGFAHFYMILYVFIWFSMVLLCFEWLYIVLWFCIVFHCFTWFYMFSYNVSMILNYVSYDFLWLRMISYDFALFYMISFNDFT